jgi:hypothetical protein
MMTTMPETKHERYTLQWILFLAFVGFVGNAYWKAVRTVSPPPAVVQPTLAHNRAFLMIHLPEVPQQETTREFVKGKLDNWLPAILREGFQPMQLSEIQRRLAQNEGLPEKAIVFVFDPAYRQTYEALHPLFEKHRIPALWLTQFQDQRLADRRFLNRHMLQMMRNSGLWEVGSYNADGAIEIIAQDGSKTMIGKEAMAWSKGSGRVALNMGIRPGRLHRLNANPQWSERELMDRLLSEVPVQRTAFLTSRRIQSRTWGLSETDVDPSRARFSLRAPINRRSVGLTWGGTRGIQDAEFELKVSSLEGELWLSVRADDEAGQGVYIGFTPEAILVEEDFNHHRERLLTGPAPESLRPLSATILVTGSQVTILTNGHGKLQTNKLHAPTSDDGVVRLMTYDRIYGLARADWITLKITPDHPSAVDSLSR